MEFFYGYVFGSPLKRKILTGRSQNVKLDAALLN